ncbi:MAG: hypothetical protein ACI9BK_003366 [Acidimicrobiales bacterium]|jgi:hypothetical protein
MSIRELQFAQKRWGLAFDRFDRDPRALCHLFLGVTPGKQPQDLLLAVRQMIELQIDFVC